MMFGSAIWTWFCVIFIAAFTSITLAVGKIEVGLRSLYCNVLLRVFMWARKRCIASGVFMPVDEDAIAEHQSRRDSAQPRDRRLLKLPSSPILSGARSRSRSRTIIQPSAYQSLSEKCELRPLDDIHLSDIVDDSIDMSCWAMEVIITDEVTQSFIADELPVWNLLTRSDQGFNFLSWRLTCIWAVGLLFRYLFLMPVRLIVLTVGLVDFILLCLLFGPLPEYWWKRPVTNWSIRAICRILQQCVSMKVVYHDRPNRAKRGGICVANHTSFLDFLVLAGDNNFAIIGAAFEGFQGTIQKLFSGIVTCKWFDRSSSDERAGVKAAMKEHTSTGGPPILIFPEGVCVNNSTVMRFRKGCFEIGAVIYPVAIKYNRLFGEPFWFQDKWYQHVAYLITSWAIKADVYYLEPMSQKADETAIDFARRVKEAIALKGEFVDIDWEGYIKFLPVREEKIAEMKVQYAQRLKNAELQDDAYLTSEE